MLQVEIHPLFGKWKTTNLERREYIFRVQIHEEASSTHMSCDLTLMQPFWIGVEKADRKSVV